MYRRIHNKQEIKQLVCDSLGTDLDLVVKRHHCKAGSVQGCTTYTTTTLFNGEETIDFYGLYDDESYGFFAVNPEWRMVRSFMVNGDKRDKKHFADFFQSIRNVIGDEPYWVPIWSDNDIAARFLSRMGTLELDNNEVKVYKICQ